MLCIRYIYKICKFVLNFIISLCVRDGYMYCTYMCVHAGQRSVTYMVPSFYLYLCFRAQTEPQGLN